MFRLHICKQQTREVEDHHRHKKLDLGSSTSAATCKKPACRCSNRRGRQSADLTESEKEARRLRRVLANRESARQTILRRKALCEELTKKAAELSEENENMKMERKAAMKEYLSLRDRNMQLKERVDKINIVKCEVAPPDQQRWPRKPPAAVPSSLVHGGGPPWPEFSWPPVLKPSEYAVSQHASICQEKWGVPALPSPNFWAAAPPPQCPSWLFPIPYLKPALLMPSVHPTAGHDGGEGAARSDRHEHATGGEDFADDQGGSSSKLTLEPGTKKLPEQAVGDTSKLCGRRGGGGAHDTLELADSASALLTRPLLDRVGSVRAPAPAETQAGLRPGKRMPAPATSMASEARRRRREIRKLKHLHG